MSVIFPFVGITYPTNMAYKRSNKHVFNGKPIFIHQQPVQYYGDPYLQTGHVLCIDYSKRVGDIGIIGCNHYVYQEFRQPDPNNIQKVTVVTRGNHVISKNVYFATDETFNKETGLYRRIRYKGLGMNYGKVGEILQEIETKTPNRKFLEGIKGLTQRLILKLSSDRNGCEYDSVRKLAGRLFERISAVR